MEIYSHALNKNSRGTSFFIACGDTLCYEQHENKNSDCLNCQTFILLEVSGI